MPERDSSFFLQRASRTWRNTVRCQHGEPGHWEHRWLPAIPARYLEALNNRLLPPCSHWTQHRKAQLSGVALPRLEKLRWDSLQPWPPLPLHEGIQQVTSSPYIAVCQTKGHESTLSSETETCQATELSGERPWEGRQSRNDSQRGHSYFRGSVQT